MGLLLRFVSKTPRTGTGSEVAGPASIIIFPGIRYERVEPAARIERRAIKPQAIKPGPARG